MEPEINEEAFDKACKRSFQLLTGVHISALLLACSLAVRHIAKEPNIWMMPAIFFAFISISIYGHYNVKSGKGRAYHIKVWEQAGKPQLYLIHLLVPFTTSSKMPEPIVYEASEQGYRKFLASKKKLLLVLAFGMFGALAGAYALTRVLISQNMREIFSTLAVLTLIQFACMFMLLFIEARRLKRYKSWLAADRPTDLLFFLKSR